MEDSLQASSRCKDLGEALLVSHRECKCKLSRALAMMVGLEASRVSRASAVEAKEDKEAKEGSQAKSMPSLQTPQPRLKLSTV